MDRRAKLIFLIVVALAILATGLYFLSKPIREQMAGQNAPPGLPSGVNPDGSTTGKPKPATPSTVPAKSDTRVQVEYRSRSFVERMWNGTSQNGFLGFRDAQMDATTNGKSILSKMQTELVAAHSPASALYEITARAVAVKIVSGNAGDATIQTKVDVIVTEGTEPAVTKQVTLTMQKGENGVYLIDKILTE